MKYLLTLGIVQAIFFALVLVLARRNSLPNKILFVWMLILAANLSGVLLAVSGFYRTYPNLFGYDTTLVFLHGPSLYLYVITSVSENPRLRSKYLIHIIPYLLFSIYLIFLLRFDHANATYEEIRKLFYEPNAILLVLEISIHALLIVYIIASSLTLHRFRTTVPKSYSFTEGIDFQWLQMVLYAFLFISGLILVSLVLSDILQLFSLEWKGYLFYVCMSLLPFYLFFHAIHRKVIYPSDEQLIIKKYKDSTLTETDVRQIQTRLNDLMANEKPHLDGHLSIAKLAGMLDIHPKQLSQVINEKHGTHFFHFVNGYRVKEFESKINNPAYKNFSLLGIAFDCGFNTKSAFSKAFKRAHGITPSEFRKGTQTGSTS